MSVGVDIGSSPNEKGTTITSFAPHELPRKIWELIEEGFRKQNVELVEFFPQSPLNKTVVAWRVVQRVPGTGASGKMHARGAGFSNILKVSPDGYVFLEYTQEHTIEFEFVVFSDSTVVADQIAWELENAVIESEGPLKDLDPGITLVFLMATADDNLDMHHQDDIVRRAIRFRASLPVRRVKVEPQLRNIRQQLQVGRTGVSGPRTTRTSSEKRYNIPVDSNQKVVDIINILRYKTESSSPIILVRDIDFKVFRDLSTNDIYIEWNDDYGSTPAVNEDFRIDFVVASIVDTKEFTNPQ